MASLARFGVRPVRYLSILRASVVSQQTYATQNPTEDAVTHTGQKFAQDDYRNIRFTDGRKLVNQQFAIDLIAADPVVVCDQRVVHSHSGGPLGHPKVYINLDPPEIHTCGYSGRKFVLKKYYNEKEMGPSITYDQYLEQITSSHDD